MNILTIDYSTNGIAAKAVLQGSLTQINAINLKSELASKISHEKKLLVDLTNVTDIDITGLNTLLMTHLKLSLKLARIENEFVIE